MRAWFEMKRASSFVFLSFSKHIGQIKQEIKTQEEKDFNKPDYV